jgi:hypothetical protein
MISEVAKQTKTGFLQENIFCSQCSIKDKDKNIKETKRFIIKSVL